MKNINILMYHNIDNSFDLNGTTVSEKAFKEQINYLQKRCYVKLLSEQLAENENNEKNIWSITFDDAFLGVFEKAFPIMEENNIKGTIYVTTGLINKNSDWNMNIGWQRYRHCSWENIKELSKYGWEIGAHTVNHLSLKMITLKQAKKEIYDSINIIQDKIGKRVTTFSYPFGHYNQKLKEYLKEIGIQNAVSVRFDGKNDIFSLGRHGVYNFDTFFMFKRLINKDFFQDFISAKENIICTMNNLSGLIINYKYIFKDKIL